MEHLGVETEIQLPFGRLSHCTGCAPSLYTLQIAGQHRLGPGKNTNIPTGSVINAGLD